MLDNFNFKRIGLLGVFLSLVMTPTIYGQKYMSDTEKIKATFKYYLKDYYPIDNGVLHRNYQGKVVKDDVAGLVKENVIQYYRLDSKYDSPLKRKMFKESQECMNFLSQMKK